MLQIKNLDINLIKDDRLLLKDFDFALNPCDKVGLIGEEGDGKSILLKTIINRENVEKYANINGEIHKKGEVLAYLPQSLDDKILEMTVETYMNKVFDISLLDYNKLYKHLSDFDLDEDLVFGNLKLSDLSGGERIKVLLLFEILKDPTVFLFDEPSNDLDFESAGFVTKLMQEMKIPLIFVSHDPELLRKVANRIVHLEQVHRRQVPRHTVFNGPYDRYVKERENQIRIQNARANKEREEFDKKAERYRRVYDSVNHAINATKNDIEGKNLKDKMASVKSLEKRFDKEQEKLRQKADIEDSIGIFFDESIDIPNSKVVLDFKLDKLLAGEKTLSYNIDLKVIGPEKICIIGKNGVGKTSLLEEIYKSLSRSNLKIGYMPQDYFEFLKDSETPISYLSKDCSREEETKVSNLLGSLNFSREEMERSLKSLSGGQKAKVFFAKMNIDRAEVLVLDEPTRNLSPLSQPEIIESLKSYKGAIIGVSHDKDFIEKVFDQLYELDYSGLHKIEIK
ncbi:ATP-binding cassette domain-containing protein [uncultured Anaerococcus sp.]|uniref:ATP-binding cassette domain-containing protein n=1 Tax=uncultured Anaerococcus sp. TaxID=293428 RepID=UPI0025DE8AA2|nr:ATP-binding cassette domain-containing protein [uncultured Anaerococcus sp.]